MKVLVLLLDFLSFCFQLSVEIIHVADYHKTLAKTTFGYGLGKFQCSLFEKSIGIQCKLLVRLFALSL